MSERFLSLQTFLGLFVAIAVALTYTIIFKQPGQLTPMISLFIAILLSRLSTPKHLAGLGVLIGIPTGFVVGIQAALQNPGQFSGVTWWVLAYLGVSFVMIIWTAYLAFLGFFYAQLMGLYKRRTIF
jgi:hypothetical protein